jgi:hypothetical protein
MYWNNNWLNNFNYTFFLNKTLFLDNFFTYIFSERIFLLFFFKLFIKKQNFFRTKTGINNSKSKTGVSNSKSKIIKYNFTKLWFIKYNNFILLSNFCFFYFKIKRSKKKLKKKNTLKSVTVFFKKKRSTNLKKKQFFAKTYSSF